MTTNSSTPAPVAHPPRSARLWIPRSGPAWVVLLVGLALVAVPAFYAAANAFLGYPLCFDPCSTPAETVMSYLIAVLIFGAVLVPVRVYQGWRGESDRNRLAAVTGVLVVLAVASWGAGRYLGFL